MLLRQEGPSTIDDGGGFDFSSLLGGSGGGGGFDFSQLTNGGAAGGLTGNQLSSTIGGVAGGIGGAFLGSPQLGAQLGQMLGGMFGGSGQQSGKGSFAGLHSTTLAPIDDAGWNKDDAAIVAWMARQNSISVEEVCAVLAYDGANTSHDAQYVWDAYAAGGTSGNGANNLSGWISRFNSSRKGLIISGTMGPTALTVATLPAVVNIGGHAQLVNLETQATQQGNQYQQGTSPGTAHDYAADYPQGQSPGTAHNYAADYPQGQSPGTPRTFDTAQAGSGGNLLGFGSQTSTVPTGKDLGTIFQGAINGATKGATDAWAGTDGAKKFKLEYAGTWFKENQLLGTGLVGLLALGGVQLVKMLSGNRKTSS